MRGGRGEALGKARVMIKRMENPLRQKFSLANSVVAAKISVSGIIDDGTDD